MLRWALAIKSEQTDELVGMPGIRLAEVRGELPVRFERNPIVFAPDLEGVRLFRDIRMALRRFIRLEPVPIPVTTIPTPSAMPAELA